MDPRVLEVAEELNYPSAAKLKQVLRERGIPHKAKDVDQLLRDEPVRQVQAAATGYNGKIVAKHKDSKWFADLIDFTASPSESGDKYILCCQDVFSRFLWTRAIKDKKPKTVANAFAEIVGEADTTPGMLKVDQGTEWTRDFADLCQMLGIYLVVKESGDQRAIATLDVSIGSLKQALARVARKKQSNDWASLLPTVTKGQNGLPNEHYLDGDNPKKARTDKELEKELIKKNQEFDKEVEELKEKRRKALDQAGNFRTRMPQETFTRIFKPKWSADTRTVAQVEGAYVYDARGNKYLTKLTRPTQEQGTTAPVAIERGGNAAVEARKREVLGNIARQTREWLTGRGRVTLGELGAFLKPLGFRGLALQARLNMKSPVAAFLRAFPELFDLRIQGSIATVALPVFYGPKRLRRSKGLS